MKYERRDTGDDTRHASRSDEYTSVQEMSTLVEADSDIPGGGSLAAILRYPF
jgi:hypothetical protein